ncbi:hypothetical protein [Ancylobacter polymorphus]|uniref:Phage tail protein n=1 Tax=Ancylobacter polymorphus TaxID=223390 RepID=A0ABU0B6B0_9HYPH|nr:hypothetical protein [Ancylobacter polymorphus]MDQ0301355.1 hypothetical protein [Ancylobacter polymorphus]
MANVDEITPYLNLPLPVFNSNTQDYDVPRLAEAFMVIDAAVQALNVLLAGKAPTSHQHEMAQIVGLVEALAGKMPGNWRPALDELTDVDVSAGANGQFLKKVGSQWIAAALQLGDVTGWQDTVISLINSAISSIVGGSPAALDTLNELAAALGNDPAFATTVSTALGNRLRIDAAQGLSAGQKAQALGNLGVSTLIQGLFDDTTETQALTTIGIGAGLRGLRTLATAAEIWAALKVGATTADAGVVRKATADDLTAGTADRYPDAATLKPALVAAGPAAFVNFAGGSSPTIRGQRNVSTVARLSAGAYRITFTTPMKTAAYVVASAISYSGGSVTSCGIAAQAAEYLDVTCMAANQAVGGFLDPSHVHLTFYEA